MKQELAPASTACPHKFSWGAITRPCHISLPHQTIFGRMCDCTGFQFTCDVTCAELGIVAINLRTPEVMVRVAQWLRDCAEDMGNETIRGTIVTLEEPDFSPEFAGESHIREDGEVIYDATLLEVPAHIDEQGRLHLGTESEEVLGEEEFEHAEDVLALADALDRLAAAWAAETLNLGADEPTL